MLVFFEATGAFCLFFRIAFYYYSEKKFDIFSEVAQVYGALTFFLTPWWRMKAGEQYIDAWWEHWIVPQWPLMVLGALSAIVYCRLKP